MEHSPLAANELQAIEGVDPTTPITPTSLEGYILSRAGDLGIYVALLFVILRWLSASGLINEWRKGQQALARLAEQLEELSHKLDKQAERTRDQIDGLERSVDNLKDRVDRLSDKLDRK